MFPVTSSKRKSPTGWAWVSSWCQHAVFACDSFDSNFFFFLLWNQFHTDLCLCLCLSFFFDVRYHSTTWAWPIHPWWGGRVSAYETRYIYFCLLVCLFVLRDIIFLLSLLDNLLLVLLLLLFFILFNLSHFINSWFHLISSFWYLTSNNHLHFMSRPRRWGPRWWRWRPRRWWGRWSGSWKQLGVHCRHADKPWAPSCHKVCMPQSDLFS